MSKLGSAIAVAAHEFMLVEDKSGRPYIEHCLYVMEGVRHLGDKYMQVAVLHDVVEDTTLSLTNLTQLGFDSDVVEAISCLTKVRGEHYFDYIDRCSGNAMALEIKLVDLEHNMQASRLKVITPKDLQRLSKYASAYTTLKQRREA